MNDGSNQKDTKSDITTNVYGKMDSGYMSLFHDNQKIGRVVFSDQGNQYEMAEGFEFDADKIYKKNDSAKEYPKSYVQGCDEGWC
ncbi:YusG family protein [Fictibacillus fluitans]|uniref:YusG family protein n=1 Tax=Fictibacillus fluitans TaxID=3058422 RepID=A0ABT8HXR4_9BACL|nr:YusG family protein [Fictibacillus sp. NE201]MDN4525571.1 YusG family protein [Fictibacillus sp. NE201]